MIKLTWYTVFGIFLLIIALLAFIVVLSPLIFIYVLIDRVLSIFDKRKKKNEFFSVNSWAKLAQNFNKNDANNLQV